ncbi:MAG: DUF2080 family transposase-associated protein [Thermodesulfobacteriota bacterium]
MAEEDKREGQAPVLTRGSVRFEVHGTEVLEKQVKQSGNSGRIYLPPNWVGKRVKIIRVD